MPAALGCSDENVTGFSSLIRSNFGRLCLQSRTSGFISTGVFIFDIFMLRSRLPFLLGLEKFVELILA